MTGPVHTPLDWAALDKFHGTPPLGEPTAWRTYWAGKDDIHGLLLAVIGSASKSLAISMFGYADAEVDKVIQGKTLDKAVYVQMNLDSTQAAGKGEAAILKSWNNEAHATSIAVGRSAHGAISHLKVAIVDGLYTVTGSTNWSAGGENLQDNVLYISRDPLVAADHRQRCDIIHDTMLAQQLAHKDGPVVHPPQK